MHLRTKHTIGNKVMSLIMSTLLCAGIVAGTSTLGANAAPIEREVGVPDFTAMSYNVRGEVAHFNELYRTPEEWKAENRSKRQLEMVLKHSPDILGVSEETYEFRRTYYYGLEGYDSAAEYLFTPATFFSPLFSNTNLPDSNAIYFKRSVFDYLGSDTIWLHHGDVQSVGKIEGETNVRGGTMIALRFKETGEKLVVGNVHLGLDNDIANQQMEIMVRETEAFAKKHGISAILYMGDFNMGYAGINSLPLSKYECSWDSDVKSFNQPGKGGAWVDHIFTNSNLRILSRLSIDGSEWIDSDTSSDHDPLIVNVCFSSYVPRGTTNNVKTSVLNGRLQIQSDVIDGLTIDNAFVRFYNENGIIVGGTQLIARKDANGKYYLADSAPIPTNAKKADLKIESSTYKDIWKG